MDLRIDGEADEVLESVPRVGTAIQNGMSPSLNVKKKSHQDGERSMKTGVSCLIQEDNLYIYITMSPRILPQFLALTFPTPQYYFNLFKQGLKIASDHSYIKHLKRPVETLQRARHLIGRVPNVNIIWFTHCSC